MFIVLPALGQPYLSHPILSCFLLCPVPSPSSPASSAQAASHCHLGVRVGMGLVWVL